MLEEIFNKSGKPDAILKDGGTDLNAGVKNWKANEGSHAICIRDVGHVIANELKHMYSKNKVMKRFLKIVSSVSKRLFATELAFLKPPKLRTKGQYQGISRLFSWANLILELMGTKGRAADDSRLARMREFFGNLSPLRAFFKRAAKDCDVSS